VRALVFDTAGFVDGHAVISGALGTGLVSDPMSPAVRDDWSVLSGDPGGRAAASGGPRPQPARGASAL
jgi:hypothetical protein